VNFTDCPISRNPNMHCQTAFAPFNPSPPPPTYIQCESLFFDTSLTDKNGRYHQLADRLCTPLRGFEDSSLQPCHRRQGMSQTWHFLSLLLQSLRSHVRCVAASRFPACGPSESAKLTILCRSKFRGAKKCRGIEKSPIATGSRQEWHG